MFMILHFTFTVTNCASLSQLIPLQHFLNEFVDNKFLPTLQAKVKRDIADATEG